jgi:hypothetical protein
MRKRQAASNAASPRHPRLARPRGPNKPLIPLTKNFGRPHCPGQKAGSIAAYDGFRPWRGAEKGQNSPTGFPSRLNGYRVFRFFVSAGSHGVRAQAFVSPANKADLDGCGGQVRYGQRLKFDRAIGKSALVFWKLTWRRQQRSSAAGPTRTCGHVPFCAAIGGMVRKKLKLPLQSDKVEGTRTYRIGPAKPAKPAKAAH